VTDATILIPTHRHAALLPFAVRSALAQESGAEIELFVVGDGVEDDTRHALAPFVADPRVRFFDRPKGERHGERLRHEVLLESTAPIFCYLGDDDLLLPGHVRRMGELLEHADLAMDLPANVWPDGSIRYYAFDLGRPEFVQLLAEGRGGGGLTGVAHTREVYDRLPFGWRPAPPGKPTDIHMWQQFLTVPGFRGATSDRLTSLKFPSPLRTHMTVEERVAELERWEPRIRDQKFPEELEALTFAAARRAAERLKLTSLRLEAELARVQRTRWWRTRRAFAELRPVRTLNARRREAR
jgi:Glycosyl transferase family 2